MPKQRRTQRVGAFGVMLLLASAAHAGGGEEGQAQAKSAAHVKLADIELVDQDGTPVRLRTDLVGEDIVVVNFVFTTCTTVCPVLSAIFTKLQTELGDRLGRDVRMLSISVDPVRDTPARLKAYSQKHGAKKGWTWVTGSKENVDQALVALGAYTPDFNRHAPTVLVGDGRTGRFTRLNGFPSQEELLARVNALTSARAQARSSVAGKD